MSDSLSFVYTPERNARGEVMFRPIMPITLIYQTQAVEVGALIDSGSDVNVLPYSVGLNLGAVWETQTRGLVLSGNLAKYEARGLILQA